ncbi:MAG TPA: AMP-dependent synthetase, partial [Aigarchaeota archaeon]|nr:AMP-dependent synthetase [Aigarchaeota archaeon]
MSYIWYPSREMVEESNVQQLLNRLKMRDYRDFIKRSVEDIGWFWSFIEKELNVEWFKPYSKVYDTSRGVEWTEWYIGGEINVVHNILDRHASSKNRNNLAFTWVGEDGSVSHYTYLRLFRESNRLANFLKGIGVSKGDVVAAYLPMLPETIVTLMATLKIG